MPTSLTQRLSIIENHSDCMLRSSPIWNELNGIFGGFLSQNTVSGFFSLSFPHKILWLYIMASGFVCLMWFMGVQTSISLPLSLSLSFNYIIFPLPPTSNTSISWPTLLVINYDLHVCMNKYISATWLYLVLFVCICFQGWALGLYNQLGIYPWEWLSLTLSQ